MKKKRAARMSKNCMVANLSRVSRNTADLLRFEEKPGKQNIRLNALPGNPLAEFRGDRICTKSGPAERKGGD